MKQLPGVALPQVQEVYSGPEGDLWELIMGEQVHIGGLKSSTELAERADISPGTGGVDLCCCTGAGMRFLIRFRQVEHMTGVDATETVVARGRERCEAEGLSEQIDFRLADACHGGLPDAEADFVWGEDAWCYVEDKPRLVSEAVRMVKPGGTIAFTDWLEGPAELSDREAARYLGFMKFPTIESVGGYTELLETNGCHVIAAEDTGRFAAHIDLYLGMLDMQLTYDALKLIGFDSALMQSLATEMSFIQTLAHAGKICQGLFVARRES